MYKFAFTSCVCGSKTCSDHAGPTSTSIVVKETTEKPKTSERRTSEISGYVFEEQVSVDSGSTR